MFVHVVGVTGGSTWWQSTESPAAIVWRPFSHLHREVERCRMCVHITSVFSKRICNWKQLKTGLGGSKGANSIGVTMSMSTTSRESDRCNTEGITET